MTQERDPGVGYFGMVRQLEGRFGYREPPEAVLLEFNTAKQGADEPLLEWADRLHRLASRAFPEVPEAYVQRQMVLRMCQGCGDKEAGHQALNQRLSTVEDAVEAIRWFQHSHKAMYGRARQVKALTLDEGEKGPGVRKVDITPRPMRENPDTRILSRLETKVAELEERTDSRFSGLTKTIDSRLSGLHKSMDRRLSSLESSMEKLTVAMQGSMGPALPNPPPKLPAPMQGARLSQTPRGCYLCGEDGHFRRECPRRAAQSPTRVAHVELEEENYTGSEEEATLQPEEYRAETQAQ